MHDDEVPVDEGTVRTLLEEQFPQWSTLPLRPVPSDGTVNRLLRLGDDLVVRLPLQAGDPAAKRAWLEAEAQAARWLRGRLPVDTPEPVVLGEPSRAYPLPWAVYRWLPGTVATAVDIGGSVQLARDLAAVVDVLWATDTDGRVFAGSGRGGALSDHDAYVARSLERSRGLVDTEALRRLWSDLRTTPRSDADAWTHGDLMPGNLLVRDGRLGALIDVGGVGPADPALDLQPAWNLLTGEARRAFREALEVGDERWRRGMGWALAQAVGCLWYYRETNPPMSRLAHHTLTELLEASSP
jgi:aminoglycoside phosphotransferase (APT) family kinase protein